MSGRERGERKQGTLWRAVAGDLALRAPAKWKPVWSSPDTRIDPAPERRQRPRNRSRVGIIFSAEIYFGFSEERGTIKKKKKDKLVEGCGCGGSQGEQLAEDGARREDRGQGPSKAGSGGHRAHPGIWAPGGLALCPKGFFQRHENASGEGKRRGPAARGAENTGVSGSWRRLPAGPGAWGADTHRPRAGGGRKTSPPRVRARTMESRPRGHGGPRQRRRRSGKWGNEGRKSRGEGNGGRQRRGQERRGPGRAGNKRGWGAKAKARARRGRGEGGGRQRARGGGESGTPGGGLSSEQGASLAS